MLIMHYKFKRKASPVALKCSHNEGHPRILALSQMMQIFCKHYLIKFITGRNEVVAKVIFLVACVKNSVDGGEKGGWCVQGGWWCVQGDVGGVPGDGGGGVSRGIGVSRGGGVSGGGGVSRGGCVRGLVVCPGGCRGCPGGGVCPGEWWCFPRMSSNVHVFLEFFVLSTGLNFN